MRVVNIYKDHIISELNKHKHNKLSKMNILKLVGKGTFNGKAAQTGITGTTRRAFSQVISNTSAEVKVRYTLHFS